jgi:hypothetical protein
MTKRMSDIRAEGKRGIEKTKLRWGIVRTKISDLQKREIGRAWH